MIVTVCLFFTSMLEGGDAQTGYCALQVVIIILYIYLYTVNLKRSLIILEHHTGQD